jgi:conjugal transfer mating pair stabilization protein TraG
MALSSQPTRRRRRARLAALLLLGATAPSHGLDLAGTLWASTAARHGLDPVLLYAVALAESARPSAPGSVTPWPWTLRVDGEPRFFDSREAARAALAALGSQREGLAIGLLGVDLRREGHRVGDPATLLDPAINLLIGAEALAAALAAAPGDLALGIGRYRHGGADAAARAYGAQVLRLADALRGATARRIPGDPLDRWRAAAVLDLVAGPESGGHYDALYRDARQREVALAALTLREVRALQERRRRTHGGSAIGRYQFLAATLEALIDRFGLTGEERFTPALQDRLAQALLTDAGVEAWLAGTLPERAFAARLARVWAGLPRDASGLSHYAGVGDNRATLAWPAVVAALRAIRSPGSSVLHPGDDAHEDHP